MPGILMALTAVGVGSFAAVVSNLDKHPNILEK